GGPGARGRGGGARLGGRAGGHAAGAGAAGHRGHVDDLAGALADHHAPDGLREEEHAGQVRRDHCVPFATRQVLERRADAIAGVIDQNVDAAERPQGLRDRVVHLPRVADVARDGQRAAPLGAHEVGDRLQRVLTATAHRHVRADPGELDRDRAADPLARPGHDRDAIAKRVGREPHLLDDRVRRGHQARDLDLLAIDQGRHLRRDLVLPVIALVDEVVETLALGFALEPAQPDVDAFIFLADEAAEDDHAHLDLEWDDLFLHAPDPLVALSGTDVVLPELEDHEASLGWPRGYTRPDSRDRV